MNIQDHIDRQTKLENQDQHVKWELIEKPKLPKRQPRAKGVEPYELEICTDYSCNNSQSTSSDKRTVKEKNKFHKKNLKHKQHSKNMETIIAPNPYQFAHIIPSVRETSGGWNTQSNDAIERRFKERQQKFAEENSESSSSDRANATTSTETSGSYKTTLQDSCELRTVNSEQVTSETITRPNIKRYKKNALMLGLLRNMDNTDVEREDTTTESSGDYYEANSFDDVASGMTDLNINDENVLQDERIGRFFQSQEDEDVYCHPLREQIQKDPGWQNLRLKRKGTESVISPRQYYINIDDDQFTFESRKPN